MPERGADTWQHVGEPVGRTVERVLRAVAARREAERSEGERHGEN